MSQMGFSVFEYAGKRKQTRHERVLAEMDQVVPWIGCRGSSSRSTRRLAVAENLIRWKPCYASICCRNGLSDPAMEEAPFEITHMCQLARLTLCAPIPKDKTILNFRHLLEIH